MTGNTLNQICLSGANTPRILLSDWSWARHLACSTVAHMQQNVKNNVKMSKAFLRGNLELTKASR